ncbi:uncharacterized protein LOC125090745 [Lutra lutra]|uniref:uncharacterized protein LOC125090745 n=1 Tax=Lutra lutra TaxID=9657 RepID=UPI001FD61942|nr:uncharacterized protein LOC125090745 [Lutra lutra]
MEAKLVSQRDLLRTAGAVPSAWRWLWTALRDGGRAGSQASAQVRLGDGMGPGGAQEGSVIRAPAKPVSPVPPVQPGPRRLPRCAAGRRRRPRELLHAGAAGVLRGESLSSGLGYFSGSRALPPRRPSPGPSRTCARVGASCLLGPAVWAAAVAAAGHGGRRSLRDLGGPKEAAGRPRTCTVGAGLVGTESLGTLPASAPRKALLGSFHGTR